MIYLFTSIGLIVGCLIGFLISKGITMKKVKAVLNRGTGKLGIIRFEYGYDDIYGCIEVEELEIAGDLTKVIIHDVLPDRKSTVQSRGGFLKKWGKNDWVETKYIKWYDDNAQRIRDNKIEEIFKQE